MRARVPAVASSFVGRVEELAAIKGLLGQARLVTLAGPGGGGKTRLAIEAVGAGTFTLCGFVELAGAGPDTDLPVSVLAGCGIRDDPGRAVLDRLHDQLRDRAGVLVLDNCEQVRDSVAVLVAGLLRECPGLRILATSRVPLGVTGETVVPVGGLPTADDGVSDDAVVLFLDRARRVQPVLPVGPDNVASARAICRLADGLPLAIELAAAHARALSLSDVEAGMADRLQFLSARDPGLLPQHRSLQACIEWSVQLAGERARRVLAAVSVFGGRFTLAAAVAVADEDRSVIETLVEHSLVQLVADDGRYLLLDTIGDYGTRELVESGDAQRVFGRLVDWAAGLARVVGEGLGRADAAALLRVDRDDAGVRAALDHAVRTGDRLDDAAEIVVDLAFAWSLRGRCVRGRAWAQRISDQLAGQHCRLAWANAFLTAYGGDLEAGVDIAVGAAELAETAGDPGTRGRALTLVGMIQMFVDPAGADPVLASAAELGGAVGDDWGHVEALQMLGYSHLFRSDPRKALECADEALPALTRLGHDQLWAWDAAIRAEVATQTGRFADAESFARTGLTLAVSVEEPVSAGGRPATAGEGSRAA